MSSKYRVGDEVTTVGGTGIIYKIAEIFIVSNLATQKLEHGYRVSFMGHVYPNVYTENSLVLAAPKWKPKFNVGDFVTQVLAVSEDRIEENICEVIKVPTSKTGGYTVKYGSHEFSYPEDSLVRIKKVETWEVVK